MICKCRKTLISGHSWEFLGFLSYSQEFLIVGITKVWENEHHYMQLQVNFSEKGTKMTFQLHILKLEILSFFNRIHAKKIFPSFFSYSDEGTKSTPQTHTHKFKILHFSENISKTTVQVTFSEKGTHITPQTRIQKYEILEISVRNQFLSAIFPLNWFRTFSEQEEWFTLWFTWYCLRNEGISNYASLKHDFCSFLRKIHL